MVEKKGEGFNMTCFYEEWELPGLGLVVAKDSAQINGFPQLSIPANHMGMTKFANSEEVGYLRIVGEIQRWTQTGRSKDLTQEEQDCLQSLSFEQMNNRGIDIEQAANGTCAWLPTHKTYRQWHSQDQGLLWISGNPGAGKSTLMKYALQSIQQVEFMSLSKPATLSFFFHGRGAEIQKTPLGLFRSLLHQLLKQFPGPLSEVVQTFQSNCKGMKKWEWYQKDLQRLLTICIPQVLEQCAVRIFIDALDECGGEAARRLVAYFQDLLSRCLSAKRGLSICFSCRHYPVILIGGGLELCVERENENDIRSYIHEKLKHAIQSDKELQTLQAEIFERSSCIFQWVALVLDRAIWQHEEGYSITYIQEQLHDTPADLDSLYKDILHGLNMNKQNHSRSLKLMQWICFAVRPLSLTELRFAMIVDPATSYSSLKQYQLSPDFVKDDKKMGKQLKSLSGGLAEVKVYANKNKPVAQFIHQSVKDYVIKGGFQILDSSSESEDISIGLAQAQLCRSCIGYFSMDEIRESVSEEVQRKKNGGFDKGSNEEINEGSNRGTNESNEKNGKGSDEGSNEKIDKGSHVSIKKSDEGSDDGSNEGTRSSSWLKIGFPFVSDYGSNERTRSSSWLKLDFPFVSYAVEFWLDHAKMAEEYGMSQAPLLDYFCWPSTQIIKAWAAIFQKFYGSLFQSLDIHTTLLHTASQHGLISAASAILDEKMHKDINEWLVKDSYGRTPLSLAAENGHKTVVRLLLEKGSDVEAKGSFGRTPLSFAAANGSETLVKLLLGKGANVESKDSNGKTPLFLAAEEGRETVVEMLLEKGADVESKGLSGWTPLFRAVQRGHKTVVKLLLEKGADVDSKDLVNRTPLSWVVEPGRQTRVELLLEIDANVKRKDSDGRTPLSLAAANGSETLVKLLLEKGADVEPKDSDGRTPLSFAAANGSETLVKLLLEKGADVEPKDLDNRTPLSWAAERGHETVAKLLLEKGADVESKNLQNRTPLTFATENGHETVVKLLLGEKC